MERSEVYKAIDTERDYQDKKWAEFSDSNNSWADWTIYIEQHLRKAKEHIYDSHNPKFLDEIRKIAALCVACAENSYILKREL